MALGTQYRMAADIQLLANSLVYSGGMRCGSDAVGEATLATNVPEALSTSGPDWLLEVGHLCPKRASREAHLPCFTCRSALLVCLAAG